MTIRHTGRRVAYLDQADFLGGAEIFSSDILGSLCEDFSISVITGGKEKKYLDALPNNVKTVEMELPRLRPFRPLAYMRTAWKLRRLCRRLDISVVHSNSVRAGMFAVFTGIPWVHFAHDFTAPGFFVRLLHRAAAVCACSQAVKNDLVAKGLRENKITVIPNGIKLEKFENITRKPFDTGRPVIAMIGRIDPWKGQDVFLEAAEIVHQRVPGARFLIFGESSAHDPATVAFEQVLRENVKNKKMGYVEFRGFLPPQEIFSEIHILVHASTKPEPFGRVALEALAAGIPIVASWDGGIPEILGDELREFGATPGNAQELAEKIIRLVQDEKLRNHFVITAKTRLPRFQLEKTTHAISRLWEMAMENSSA